MKQELINLSEIADQLIMDLEKRRVEARRLIRKILYSVHFIEWTPDEFWLKKIAMGDTSAMECAMTDADYLITFECEDSPISKGSVLSIKDDFEKGIIITLNDVYSRKNRCVGLEDVCDPEKLLDFVFELLYRN